MARVVVVMVALAACRAIRHDYSLPHVVVGIKDARFRVPARLGDHVLVQTSRISMPTPDHPEQQQQPPKRSAGGRAGRLVVTAVLQRT